MNYQTLKTRSPGALTYRTDSGVFIMLKTDFVYRENDVLYSQDGKNFVELFLITSTGYGKKQVMHCCLPGTGRTLVISRTDDDQVLLSNGATLKKVNTPEEASVLRLPESFMVAVPETATLFRGGNDNGHGLLYLSESNETPFFSPFGTGYRQISQLGYTSNSTEHKISFEDPRAEVGTAWRTGEIVRHNDVVSINGVNLQKAKRPSDIFLFRIPTTRTPEYLFQLQDNDYVYVSADKYNYSYESFRFYTGNGEKMREVEITERIRRLRDGGTTYIPTAEGVLFSPTRIDSDITPTWGKKQLTKLDAKNFNISEKNGVVTVKNA